MQLSLDKYLSDVERHLETLPPNIRAGEIEEMASHLQQLRADFLARGHTVEEAEALATARFGTARRAGLRLRDVWEGNRGVVASFVAVAVSNCGLQFANLSAGVWFLFEVAIFGNRALVEPLTTVIQFWFWWTLLLMPFGVNFMLGRWGGRRVALAVLAAHLPLLALQSRFPHFWMGLAGFKLTLPYLLLVFTLVAFAGAWSGSASKRRQRFALIGGASLETASVLLQRRLPVRRILLRLCAWLAVLGLAAGAAFVVVKTRVDDVLRPPTPEAAVRVMLSDPGFNHGEMEPATNVSARLLPATPQELKKGERRVFYRATMHATESFRQQRVAYLQKRVRAAVAAGRDYEVETYGATLSRVKPGRCTLSRIARVKKTAHGWEVDTSGDLYNQPHAWLYADYGDDYLFASNR